MIMCYMRFAMSRQAQIGSLSTDGFSFSIYHPQQSEEVYFSSSPVNTQRSMAKLNFCAVWLRGGISLALSHRKTKRNERSTS